MNPPAISQITKTILRLEGVKAATISLVFVTAQKIRALNKKYLKRTYATDVLAFDLSDEASSLVGDIFISTDAALQNARNYGLPVTVELSLYIIHGILHLIGYNDHKKGDIQRMRQREEELLKSLGKKITLVVR